MTKESKDLISRIANRIDLGDLSIEKALESAVHAYEEDPLFAIPEKACRIHLEHGAATEIILLGATPFSRLFLSEMGDRVRPTAVVDDFQAKDGNDFEGLPVITSEEMIRRASGSNRTITVNGCRYDRSRRFFKSLTRRHEVTALNFEQAVRLFGANPTLDHRVDDWGPVIAARFAEFQALSGRFADDYSRFTLSSVLLTQLTCNPEWLLNAARIYCTLYFRSGLFTQTSHERFADCGASIGESTSALLDLTDGEFSRVWMIEPDRQNCEVLRKFIGECQDSTEDTRISLHECALGDRDESMAFAHEGGHGGHLIHGDSSSAQSAPVPVRRLDDLLDDSPTLIKMDIEGAELAAIRGATGIIGSAHPRMALSAYHRPTDLLDLPKAILDLWEGYRIGLRHHTEERWDTCLYFY